MKTPPVMSMPLRRSTNSAEKQGLQMYFNALSLALLFSKMPQPARNNCKQYTTHVSCIDLFRYGMLYREIEFENCEMGEAGVRLSIFLLRMLRATIALGALACAGEMARAQQKIGSTAAVIKDVSRELLGAAAPLKAGDAVFRNEIVRTAAASKAKLIFLNSTNLVIGPGSETTLDEFVYSGPTELPSAQKMQVSLTRGVFRFTTGTLDKKAYLISTPVASIAVQGTELDINIGVGLTRVTLVEGRALVCPRRPGVTFQQQQRACAKAPGGRQAPGCDCVELNDPGQTAQVRAAGGSTRASLSSTPVDSAPLCASASLCSAQAYTSATPVTGFPRGALCGH